MNNLVLLPTDTQISQQNIGVTLLMDFIKQASNPKPKVFVNHAAVLHKLLTTKP